MKLNTYTVTGKVIVGGAEQSVSHTFKDKDKATVLENAGKYLVGWYGSVVEGSLKATCTEAKR